MKGVRLIGSIEVVPHQLQEYETVGNWKICPRSKKIEITVSDMGNDDYAWLVAIHEIVETILCIKAGIKEQDVTAFDIDFENKRIPGNIDEPGDDPASPYRHEHRIATIVEMIVADAMGVDWREYEQTVNSL